MGKMRAKREKNCFEVFYSNKLEYLSIVLCKLLADKSSLSDPFRRECVVVSTKGMQTYLSLELSKRNRIAANIDFKRLPDFLWECLKAADGAAPQEGKLNQYSRESLQWRLLALFLSDDFAKRAPLTRAALIGYLSPDQGLGRNGLGSFGRESGGAGESAAGAPGPEEIDQRKAYALSEQIALVFARYIVNRDDWMRAWDEGRSAFVPDDRGADSRLALAPIEFGRLAPAARESVLRDERWQSELWRVLRDGINDPDMVSLWGGLGAKLRAGALFDDAALPERVFIFSVNAIYPSYLEALKGLSRYCDVRMFCLNPCKEYWGDVLPPLSALKSMTDKELADGAKLQGRVGHPLLAELGKQGRDFFELLHEAEEVKEDYETGGDLPAIAAYDLYAAEGQGGESLLRRLQNDILNLRWDGFGLGAQNQDAEAREAAAADAPREDRAEEPEEETEERPEKDREAEPEEKPEEEPAEEPGKEQREETEEETGEEAEGETNKAAKSGAGAEDRSIILNGAHSPKRELEILKDCLIDYFERQRQAQAADPGGFVAAGPDDVVVLSPNIELYAPFIDSVFSDAAPDGVFIPHCVSDRQNARSGPYLSALSLFFDFCEGRFELEKTLPLLQNERILARYGIDKTDAEVLGEWIKAIGVTWGWDDAEREEWERRQGQGQGRTRPLGEGAPGAGERGDGLDEAFKDDFTWKRLIDSLLAGALLPAGAEGLGARGIAPETVPLDQIDAALKFAAAIEGLRAEREKWSTPAPAAQWAQRIRDFSAQYAQGSETEYENLSRQLDQWVEICAQSGFDLPVTPQVARLRIGQWLSAPDPNRFMANGVTFCNLVPMRNIPFRFVAALGLNAGDFPRMEPRRPFDLTQTLRRKGDIDALDDDRYLFLETLLSARETLYLSFVSRNQKSNDPLEPSALVSSLGVVLDAMRAAPSDGASAAGAQRPWMTQHPLQPFSTSYFNRSDPRLFAYRPSTLQALASPRARPAPFLGEEDYGNFGLSRWGRIEANSAQEFLAKIEAAKALTRDKIAKRRGEGFKQGNPDGPQDGSREAPESRAGALSLSADREFGPAGDSAPLGGQTVSLPVLAKFWDDPLSAYLKERLGWSAVNVWAPFSFERPDDLPNAPEIGVRLLRAALEAEGIERPSSLAAPSAEGALAEAWLEKLPALRDGGETKRAESAKRQTGREAETGSGEANGKENEPFARERAELARRNLLPQRHLSALDLGQLENAARFLARHVFKRIPRELPVRVEVGFCEERPESRAGGRAIVGTLPPSDGLNQVFFSRKSGKGLKFDALEIWIRHLAFVADLGQRNAQGAEMAATYCVSAKGEIARCMGVAPPEARQILRDLLDLRDYGLLHPLPFLPDAIFNSPDVAANWELGGPCPGPEDDGKFFFGHMLCSPGPDAAAQWAGAAKAALKAAFEKSDRRSAALSTVYDNAESELYNRDAIEAMLRFAATPCLNAFQNPKREKPNQPKKKRAR